MKVYRISDPVGAKITEIEREGNRRKKLISVLLYTAGAFFLLGFWKDFLFTVSIIFFFIWLFLHLFNLDKTETEKHIYSTGKEGESRLIEFLRNALPDDYVAFTGVPVKNGDIDCLIVGPNGIFALEVKNHRGVIIFNGETWKQVKTGKRGGIYEGIINNPGKQILSAIRFLKEEMKTEGLGNLYIRGIVVFTNDDVNLQIEKYPTTFDVCKLADLPALIKNRKENNNQELYKRVIDYLKKRMQVPER